MRGERKVNVEMDNLGHRENGRQRPDQYKPAHTQWMMPQRQMKEHDSMNLLVLVNERDSAIREREHALAEKKAAVAERDMAMMQRDAAVAERDAAIAERDNALAALELARAKGMGANNGHGCLSGSTPLRGTKKMHHNDYFDHPQLSDAPYDRARAMQIVEAYPIAAAPVSIVKEHKAKRPKKDIYAQPPSFRKSSKSSRKSKGAGSDDRSWRTTGTSFSDEDPNRINVTKKEWKDDQELLGLNQVTFDESTMPVPACSCTGKLRPCYKWGSGGWQSSCCTMNMSMYPLPVMPNKRHARVGGRKMSGSAFIKLLSRLAADGHDLSTAVDLKDHWSKHGTNRYITIK